MINLQTLFENFFNTDRISDDNLKKFTQDHIQRLTNNNGSGMFTELLTDTNTAYTTYFGKITDKDLAFAVQQSLTMSADNLMETFKSSVSQKEGIIRGTYGKDSPVYQEFFPLGVSEYSNATKANIETLMTRMVNSSTAHVAELGLPFKTLFTDIKTNYIAARTAQLAKISEVSTDRTDTHTTRDVIETQLCKNLHFIGYSFPGNADRCMDFFDQSIVRPSQSSASDGIGRAAGIITNETTGVVLQDVVIDYADVATPSRKSKSDGTYRSSNVYIGGHRVRFSKPGFTTIEIPVVIVDAGDTPLDITLRPE
jgi:hypothetical protein